MILDIFTKIEDTTDWYSWLTYLCGSGRVRDNGEWVSLCPVHSEHTPSFHFRIDKEVYICYGCNIRGGGMYDLVVQKLGYTDEEYLEQCYQFSSMNTTVTLDEQTRRVNQQERTEQDTKAYQAEIEKIEQWYHHGYSPLFVSDWTYSQFTSEHFYLFNRGILPSTLHHFKVALLTSATDYRIFIPMALNNQVYGYQRRGIGNGEFSPKYLTQTGFNKTQSVYGEIYDNTVLLCEGITDVWVAHQRGIYSVVTSLGAKVSQEQMQSLVDHRVSRIIMASHHDTAGDTAYLGTRLMGSGVGIEVIRLDLACDIADSTRDDFYASYARAQTSFEKSSCNTMANEHFHRLYT